MTETADYDIAELEEQLADDKALEKELREDFFSEKLLATAEALGDARAARKVTESAIRAVKEAENH